jgi:hypothetical protein
MDISSVSPTPSEQQQYALKWNDFHSSILSSFRHLRDEEDFVDVTLACDQKSFTAHKVVLIACSPYFRKLLKANPCEHPIVILRDIRSEDVENLLRFMYNGEVNIGQDQLSDFLKIAQLLQIRGLADVTNQNLNKNLIQTSISTQLNLPSLTATLGPEMKASPTSTSIQWDFTDDSSQHTPPPQKRIKSAELYKKQHGLTDDQLMTREIVIGQHPLHRERDKSKEPKDTREKSLEVKDSLLSQALEGGPTLIIPQKHSDLASLQAQSTGEDSNSSDTAASDAGDGLNGSLDHSRTPTFPGSFLGIPGFLPGPSGIHGSDNFVSRRSLEMRVRATDPRPCPKCGKIYRSAHTLRTHLEDKHTICPGYRCVLCGTVAKSRNSLHSHMSRQHRGISTKDLPVLPMPSPFDPELASRLLAKAGVKISPAELRARASPTGTRRSDMKLEIRSGEDSDLDDPEDLTMSQTGIRKFDSDLPMSPNSFNHPNTTITKVKHESISQKMMDSKDSPLQHGSAATGSAILDTYIQFITENTFGMGMSQEQATAALHAAKLAQINAMGRNLDKIPPGFLHPQLNISKTNNNQNSQDTFKSLSLAGVTIEPAINNTVQSNSLNNPDNSLEIRRSNEQSKNSDMSLDQPHNIMSNSNNNNNFSNNNNSSSSSNIDNKSSNNIHNNNNTINSYSNKEDTSADEKNLSDDESIAIN